MILKKNFKLLNLHGKLKGARSVRNDIKIKEDFNFQQSAKDF